MQSNSTSDSSHIVSVLAIPSFRFLWLAQLLSQIAFNMLTFLLGVLIYESTRSNAAVSVLYFTVGVPAALFGIISGVYVDRFNKHRLLVSTTLARAVLLVLIYLVRSNLPMVYIILAVISLLSQFFLPAQAALIPSYVPQKLLLSANSLFILTFYSAYIGGFVMGGPLLAALGAQTLIVILVGLFILSSLLLFLLPQKETLQKNDMEPLSLNQLQKDIGMVISFIKHTPVVQQSILLLTMAQAIMAIFMTLGPGFADKLLSLKVTDASVVILGPAALGMILGALFLSSYGARFRKRSLINSGIIMSGVILVFVSLLVRTQDDMSLVGWLGSFLEGLHVYVLPISIGSFFFLGAANSLMDISCNTALQERTSDEIRGRVYGVLSSLISGVAIMPVLLSGILADFFGIAKIIFIIGLFMVAFGMHTMGWFKKLALRR